MGEGVCLESRFSAESSLFFANCHCSNGEACAIFAGPYCVTHHRATLLIAGYFSFFNAGSGANQSNHLYRTGPVHQGIHLRGCKLGSDAYVLLPARTGAFSIVIGRHHKHHDTVDMPFSYLMEEDDSTYLFPAANLHSFGTLRDVRKWPKRDRRVGVARDIVDSAMFSPYTVGQMLRSIGICNQLLTKHASADVVTWNRVKIKSILLRKGLKVYTQAVRAYLGELLDGFSGRSEDSGLHDWVDLSGMIAPKARIEALLDEVDRDGIATLEQLDAAIRDIHARFAEDARGWALYAASVLLGKEVGELTPEDIASIVEQGAKDGESLQSIVEADAEKDFGSIMAVGYGIDALDREERDDDFRAVRRR